jgi:hypothetical protein
MAVPKTHNSLFDTVGAMQREKSAAARVARDSGDPGFLRAHLSSCDLSVPHVHNAHVVIPCRNMTYAVRSARIMSLDTRFNVDIVVRSDMID